MQNSRSHEVDLPKPSGSSGSKVSLEDQESFKSKSDFIRL